MDNIKIEFSDDNNYTYSKLHKEIIQEELENLSPIIKGTIALDIRYIYESEKYIEISYFIRSTAGKDAYIGNVEFGIFEGEGNKQILIKKENLKHLGKIPTMGAKIGKIIINKSELIGIKDYQCIDMRFVNKLEIMECKH